MRTGTEKDLGCLLWAIWLGILAAISAAAGGVAWLLL